VFFQSFCFFLTVALLDFGVRVMLASYIESVPFSSIGAKSSRGIGANSLNVWQNSLVKLFGLGFSLLGGFE
jgi:hypothetical protein